MAKHRDDGGPAVEIPLVGGGLALVSQCDAERVQAHQWRMTAKGYVQRKGANSGSCLLHRFVLDAKRGREVHHKNEQKTDCRRNNLEELSPSEHQSRHKHLVVARNLARRIHAVTANCKACGAEFTKHPDHRGRQVCCSKRCAISRAVSARMEAFHAAR